MTEAVALGAGVGLVIAVIGYIIGYDRGYTRGHRVGRASAEPDTYRLVEHAAAAFHEAWASWALVILDEENISRVRRQRWKAYLVPYDGLPEEAKEKDRAWARYALDLVAARRPVMKQPRPFMHASWCDGLPHPDFCNLLTSTTPPAPASPAITATAGPCATAGMAHINGACTGCGRPWRDCWASAGKPLPEGGSSQ